MGWGMGRGWMDGWLPPLPCGVQLDATERATVERVAAELSVPELRLLARYGRAIQRDQGMWVGGGPPIPPCCPTV